jgi:hypothetical protein
LAAIVHLEHGSNQLGVSSDVIGIQCSSPCITIVCSAADCPCRVPDRARIGVGENRDWKGVPATPLAFYSADVPSILRIEAIRKQHGIANRPIRRLADTRGTTFSSSLHSSVLVQHWVIGNAEFAFDIVNPYRDFFLNLSYTRGSIKAFTFSPNRVLRGPGLWSVAAAEL